MLEQKDFSLQACSTVLSLALKGPENSILSVVYSLYWTRETVQVSLSTVYI